MSYGFEDDSALEELLNQQLDRRKQQSQHGLGSMPTIASARPTTAATTKPAQRSSAYQPSIPAASSSVDPQRPSTASVQSSANRQYPAAVSSSRLAGDGASAAGQSGASTSKMAIWLDSGRSASIKPASSDPLTVTSGAAATPIFEQPAISSKATTSVAKQSMANSKFDNSDYDAVNNQKQQQQISSTFDDSILREEILQEMSKQRLIQLILSHVLPAIQQLKRTQQQQQRRSSVDERKSAEIATELEQLREELQLEKNRAQSMSLRHSNEIELIESKWIQINKQLESRLEINEREFNQAIDRQKAQLDQLESEHKRQLDKLSENYQTKLSDERQQFEVTLKRRDEFHQLELESKLKVNCELVKLDTIFSEWDQMIKATIGELSGQFKTIEGLLDKQTIEVNGTNSDLARKTGQLSEHYEKFGRQGEQLSQLALQMNEILPRFSKLQQDNEILNGKMTDRLGQFLQRNDDLRAKEAEIERIKDDLAREKDKLSEDRFQLALSSNRLAYKEERIIELIQSNEETGVKLGEQKRSQLEREVQLATLKASLEFKSDELKEQNYDLHLSRKKLIEKQEKLAKLELDLNREKKSLRKQLVQIREEAKKITEFRERTQEEFSQLRRLQKSLVCSICLDRLFKDGENHHEAQQSALAVESGSNKWHSTLEFDHLAGDPTARASAKSQPGGAGGGGHDDTTGIGAFRLERREFESELAKLSRYIQADSKRLDAESKYVELLSIGG